MQLGSPKTNRSSAVAGRFYPGGATSLKETVDALLGESTGDVEALAVLSPHAGYIYSGRTAGRVFAAVRVPDRVVVLCPNHTGRGSALSIWAKGAWELPTGTIPVDEDLAERILHSHSEFRADTRAHLLEHAIEVQLPFLYARNPNLRFVGIVVSRLGRETLIEVGRGLATVIRELGEPVLLVASTDMSHYVPASTAERLDRLALDRVEALDAAGLFDVVERNHISMCGVMPSTVVLAAAIELGASRSRVIDYTHSGMVTGDDSAVVGYAGAIVS